jgi:hypothetical protein
LALAAALQDLGRSVQEEEDVGVFAEESLEDVIPRLTRTLPDCDFLRRYQDLCWRFGKTPPSWRARPPFWRSFWEAGDAGAVHAIRSAMRGEARDARAVQRRARLDRDREEARVLALIAARRPADVARFERLLESTRC